MPKTEVKKYFKKKFKKYLVGILKLTYICRAIGDNPKKLKKSIIMNYELKVTETKNKAGKFHYQVVDENGNIISERKSNNEYIYCTINGKYYSSKLGNIQKNQQYNWDMQASDNKEGYNTFAYKK